MGALCGLRHEEGSERPRRGDRVRRPRHGGQARHELDLLRMELVGVHRQAAVLDLGSHFRFVAPNCIQKFDLKLRNFQVLPGNYLKYVGNYLRLLVSNFQIYIAK